MSVKIVTDSTCDLPAGVTEKLDIRVIPLYIRVGGRDYLDGIDMSREEFYQRLPTFPTHPSTAVPSPEKFRSIYTALADDGASEVISIHIASTLSATYSVAQSAAAETKEVPVTVLDSRQLSMGTGFLVQTAAEMAQLGASARDILAKLEEQIHRTYTWAMLDTLTFLRRSGRMNRVISYIGDFIQLKPLLHMHDGVSGVDKVRTRKNGVARLVEEMHKHSPFEKIAFLHANAAADAHTLIDRVRHLLPSQEMELETLNPVLGSHLGPGVIGFSFVTQK